MNDDLSPLFVDAKEDLYAKGRILVQPDIEPKGVYLVVSGYVKTYVISEKGETNLISITGPGDIFPLYWALDHETRKVSMKQYAKAKLKCYRKKNSNPK